MDDITLEDDGMCIGCGKHNAMGLKMEFDHREPGVLRSQVVFRKEHQGFKDVVHGGMVGLVMDEIMVNLLWYEKIPSVSAELNVRLKKPTQVGESVHLEARIDRCTPRAIYVTATAKNSQGEELASAQATCLRIKKHNIPRFGNS